MGFLLPGHTETFTVTKIGNLECTVSGQEQIFRLEVTVCDTHFVHILNTPHQLLEKAVGFGDF